MKSDQTHIIQKVFLEIYTNSKEKAFLLKDNINTFLDIEVFPEIELYFEKLTQQLPDFAVQIDKLELDINTQNLELNTELKQRLIQAVKNQIEKSLTPNEVTKLQKNSPKLLNKEGHQLETLLYFIQYGMTPWWHGETSFTEVLEEQHITPLLQQPDLKTKLYAILHLQDVQKRLINQLSNTVLEKIITLYISDSEKEVPFLQKMHKQLISFTFETRKQFYLILLDTIVLHKEINTTIIKETIEGLQQKKSTPLSKNTQTATPPTASIPKIKESLITQDDVEDVSHPISDVGKIKENLITQDNVEDVTHPISDVENNTFSTKKTSDTSSIIKDTGYIATDTPQLLETGVHVKNAGLILLHPFLRHLFLHCNLIDADKNLTHPELAVHILHYLCTGKTQQAESDLLFEKFLCNIPLHHSINRHIEITEYHKEHTEKVLDATRKNWSSMNKSSYGLLQNEFLQRPGKLEFHKEDATLTIERKTQDILLKKLSWGISMVHLPWKKGYIHVHWN